MNEEFKQKIKSDLSKISIKPSTKKSSAGPTTLEEALKVIEKLQKDLNQSDDLLEQSTEMIRYLLNQRERLVEKSREMKDKLAESTRLLNNNTNVLAQQPSKGPNGPNNGKSLSM